MEAPEYKKGLEEIAAWKGFNTEYWVAVDIIKKYNLANNFELKKLKEGCDCWNEDFIMSKFKDFKEKAKEMLSTVVEAVVETVVETIVEAPASSEAVIEEMKTTDTLSEESLEIKEETVSNEPTNRRRR
jgi:hypothetical protein